jgi:hypothetical protein
MSLHPEATALKILLFIGSHDRTELVPIPADAEEMGWEV